MTNAPTAAEIRASQGDGLPRQMQFPLTWLMGQPLGDGTDPRDAPPWRVTPMTYLATTLVLFGVAMAALIALMLCLPSVKGAQWAAWLLVVYYLELVTAGSARVIYIVLAHHATHRNFTGDEEKDKRLTDWLTALVFMMPEQEYYHSHVEVHHSKTLATLDDHDVQMLLYLGLRPGMTRSALWRRFACVLVSPAFHAYFFRHRLAWNFGKDATRERRRAVGLMHGVPLVLAVGLSVATGNLLPLLAWFMALALPVYLLFQASALGQWASEHMWLKGPQKEGEPYKLTLARLTNGRFLGDLYPRRTGSFVRFVGERARWWTRLFFVHLPLRIALLPGDLICHDLHHRRRHDWTCALYERARYAAICATRHPHELPYTEVIGVVNAINAVFTVFATLPPLPDSEKITPLDGEILVGM